MTNKNGDMPAMPSGEKWVRHDALLGLKREMSRGPLHKGLTKREQFAMAAMQGLLSGGYCIDDPRNRINDLSSEAVALADALLAQLEK